MKKYFPFLIALGLHLLVFSFFLKKPRETVYPDIHVLNHHANGINFNLLSGSAPIKSPSLKPTKKPAAKDKTPALNKNQSDLEQQNIHQSSNQMTDLNAGTNSTGSSAGEVNQNSNLMFEFMENPVYPKIARAKGIEGFVKVKIYFTDKGTVEKIDILESSHSKMLEDSVKNSLLKWKISSRQKMEIVKNFEFKLNQ